MNVINKDHWVTSYNIKSVIVCYGHPRGKPKTCGKCTCIYIQRLGRHTSHSNGLLTVWEIIGQKKVRKGKLMVFIREKSVVWATYPHMSIITITRKGKSLVSDTRARSKEKFGFPKKFIINCI